MANQIDGLREYGNKKYTTIRTRTPQLYTQMSTLQTQFNRKIIIMVAWVVTIPLNKCRVFPSLTEITKRCILSYAKKKINVSLVIYHFIWNSEHDR